MNKIEKWLWSILIILIVLIIFVVLILIYYNEEKKDDNILSTVDDILIDYKTWYCYDALYYTPDGTKNILDVNELQISFYDEDMEKCTNNKCQRYNYDIKDGMLFLDGEYLNEEYKLIYEDDILILEENRDIGSKIVYYFSYPVG